MVVNSSHDPPAAAGSSCPATPEFSATMHADGALHLRGELDLAGVPRFAQALAHARFTSGDELTVDLSDLAFCSCSGLSALLTERSRRLRIGARLVLARPTRQMRRVLSLTGLDAAFDILPNGNTDTGSDSDTDTDTDTDTDRAGTDTAPPAAGPTVGSWRYDNVQSRWWWSPQMYTIHGFEPGEVMPSSTVLLAHTHPDDTDRVATAIDALLRTGEPSCSWHRLRDARRGEHGVLLVGAGTYDDTGTLASVHGFLVDLSGQLRLQADDAIRQAIARTVTDRATIEQAKGMLMAINDIDAEQAFGLLVRRSQQHNLKLRHVAADLVQAHDPKPRPPRPAAVPEPRTPGADPSHA